MTYSRQISDFICALRFDTIPESTTVRARQLMTDTLGVGLAGTRHPNFEAALKGVLAVPGTGGDHPVIGTGLSPDGALCRAHQRGRLPCPRLRRHPYCLHRARQRHSDATGAGPRRGSLCQRAGGPHRLRGRVGDRGARGHRLGQQFPQPRFSFDRNRGPFSARRLRRANCSV